MLMAKKIVITDLDNTLYSWVNYIIPALEAMIDSLVKTTGFDKELIRTSLRDAYEDRGTNEYAFVLQEAKIFRELREKDFNEFAARVMEPARIAFSNARQKYLELFPAVYETLRFMSARSVKVVAWTDAPVFAAGQRLKFLKIDKLVDSLFAMENPAVPQTTKIPQNILKRMENGFYQTNLKNENIMPRDWEKPCAKGLEKIINSYGISRDEAVVVGDNRAKDMLAAKSLGIDCLWARYGTYISKEYRERLDLISAPSISKRFVAPEKTRDIEVTGILSGFDGVIDYI